LHRLHELGQLVARDCSGDGPIVRRREAARVLGHDLDRQGQLSRAMRSRNQPLAPAPSEAVA
jgi:hypothetical protein